MIELLIRDRIADHWMTQYNELVKEYCKEQELHKDIIQGMKETSDHHYYLMEKKDSHIDDLDARIAKLRESLTNAQKPKRARR